MLHAQLYFLFVFDFPEMVAPYLKCIFVWGSIKFLFLFLFLFLLSLILPRCPFVYAHTFLTFLTNWSRDRIHPINGLDSSCKPHVTRAYQSVVWKILEWKHVSQVSLSTGMVYTTVWTFLRAGKLYITDRKTDRQSYLLGP